MPASLANLDALLEIFTISQLQIGRQNGHTFVMVSVMPCVKHAALQLNDTAVNKDGSVFTATDETQALTAASPCQARQSALKLIHIF